MFRLVLLAVSMLGAASLTSSPAAAQRVQITPGNTCLMVIHVLPRCPRRWVPVCTRPVPCTLRGRQSRVCAGYLCIPPPPNIPNIPSRPGPMR
jgi:hypothetical protein